MSLQVDTRDRVDVVDVTDRVRATVPDGLDRGVCTVFVAHTTAGVVVNEPEAGLLEDVAALLATLVPRDAGYEHDATDDNAAAHLRATLLGEHVAVPVRDGDLALGPWQSVLLVECDGPRTRSLRTTVTPASGRRRRARGMAGDGDDDDRARRPAVSRRRVRRIQARQRPPL